MVKVGAPPDRAALEPLFHCFAPRIRDFEDSRDIQAVCSAATDDQVREVMLRIWHKAQGFDTSMVSESSGLLRQYRQQDL